ncbi:MAG: DUF1015 domain-containing protein [Phycisphaerae bacterium]|nr:DUF1015 domain-containing protein [Phycisphaerae bacterium]
MDIKPFCGWRYAGTREMGVRLAPPYDVLTAANKQSLLAGSEYNIVAVDLPHVPPKEVGPDEAYRAAAERLSQWQAGGVLRQDKPALYVYQQEFELGARRFRRVSLLCGVRATPLGQDVIPHEHTFAGPKADRLKLTEYTRMQLSPIFGFYNDDGAVPAMLAEISQRPADFHARLDAPGQYSAIDETLWVVDDPAAIDRIRLALTKTPVFIADGHHRYTTALNYRDQLRAAGKIDDDHEANFVLFALVHRDDPGMIILPTHRVVSGLAEGFDVCKLIAAAPEFAWKRARLDSLDTRDIDASLRPHGPSAMAVLGPEDVAENSCWIATLRDARSMADAAPDQLPAWRSLNVAILHTLLLDRDLAPWRTADTAIDYTPDAATVLAACKGEGTQGGGMFGVCLQSTPLPAVEEIALAGANMPHKSTYFYPKLTTGVVLKPLE